MNDSSLNDQMISEDEPWLEEVVWVQHIRAKIRAREKALAERDWPALQKLTEEEAEGLRWRIVAMVEHGCPRLMRLTRERAARIHDVEGLSQMYNALFMTKDEPKHSLTFSPCLITIGPD